MLKQNLQQLIAKGKIAQAMEQLLQATASDKDLHHEVLAVSARFAHYEKQVHGNTADSNWLATERNKINAALLFIIDKLEDVGNSNNFANHKKLDDMKQEHHGSGDNVAGDKIGRQINMGQNSTYIENQNAVQQQNSQEKEVSTSSPSPKLPETPSGVLVTLLGWLPENFRPITAIVILGLVTFVGYHYFMPKKEELPKVETPTVITTSEKVYVSGIIHINNGEPKPNEIKRMTLRDIDANPGRFDAAGNFTFTDVKIPANKRLLVDVTFSDGKTIPTEELIVGEADKNTKTVRLPDLYATRPQPAKNGKPVTIWKIQVIENKGNGNIKATQN